MLFTWIYGRSPISAYRNIRRSVSPTEKPTNRSFTLGDVTADWASSYTRVDPTWHILIAYDVPHFSSTIDTEAQAIFFSRWKHGQYHVNCQTSLRQGHFCLNRVGLRGRIHQSLLSRRSDAHFRHGSLNRLLGFFVPDPCPPKHCIWRYQWGSPIPLLRPWLFFFFFYPFQVRTLLQCNMESRTGNPEHYPPKTNCCWHYRSRAWFSSLSTPVADSVSCVLLWTNAYVVFFNKSLHFTCQTHHTEDVSEYRLERS